MLLQPLVENALQHGVLQRGKGGHVEVHLASAVNGIHCRVSDNGPGLATTPEFGGNGKPSGLRITDERIRLVNGRHGGGLRLNDLQHKASGASGTEVHFTVRTEDLWA
jgi:sensor histidine kinase YesM